MKIRLGFVSNSSSSSFITIGSSDNLEMPQLHSAYSIREIRIPETFGGTTEWECSAYSTFADRLNWAALMCYLKESPTGYANTETPWTDMLDFVLRDAFDIDNIRITYYDPYSSTHEAYDSPNSFDINHGCHPLNGEESTKMFKDEQTLRLFLFAKDSKIEIERD